MTDTNGLLLDSVPGADDPDEMYPYQRAAEDIAKEAMSKLYPYDLRVIKDRIRPQKLDESAFENLKIGDPLIVRVHFGSYTARVSKFNRVLVPRMSAIADVEFKLSSLATFTLSPLINANTVRITPISVVPDIRGHKGLESMRESTLYWITTEGDEQGGYRLVLDAEMKRGVKPKPAEDAEAAPRKGWFGIPLPARH